MKNAVIGFPRVGKLRELKFVSEKYFRGDVGARELLETGKELRKEHLTWQKELGIEYISSNDFSFYDGMLDTAVLLNVIPKCYQNLNLSKLDTYFAMARGYQANGLDVPALAMKKWFNTNYHYLVPEFEADTQIKLVGDKPFEEYLEAKELGIETKPVLIGPFTFLKLSSYEKGNTASDYMAAIIQSYIEILKKFNDLKATWLQFDEPALVCDLTKEDITLFEALYQKILASKGSLKVLLQTYFGDVRDCYQTITTLAFDGIGLDFIEGKQTKALIESYGFPEDKVLFAGLLNGKNIWKCNYKKTLDTITELKNYAREIVISTSCSLLHVPYTLKNEGSLTEDIKQYFSFALEKLQELKELSSLADAKEVYSHEEFIENQKIFKQERLLKDDEVEQKVASLSEKDFVRTPERKKRQKLQKTVFQLPPFPTTTIGSFPQTKEVKKNRSLYQKGEIDKSTYDQEVFSFIKDCIKKQEELGLDVLVHGEYERNDMVEFFGEHLNGYIFTEKGWVQSYGTRCVKPPIIFGDVKRTAPITVDYSAYAQSLTTKPVKGMLTGPVTILNWSFPREDITLKEMALQIGIAIREEVLDLEKAGIQIIQIDEAALKEKLPLRKADWYNEYLDWAIPAFRLCHSSVKPETQIHTHMCYSEFNEIIKEIDEMDADVISFEASRSKLTILDSLKENHFETEVGPGVYDIHSPRVPSVEEIVATIKTMLTKIEKDKLWINPDCGLKTRGIKETDASLNNLVRATKIVREQI